MLISIISALWGYFSLDLGKGSTRVPHNVLLLQGDELHTLKRCVTHFESTGAELPKVERVHEFPEAF